VSALLFLLLSSFLKKIVFEGYLDSELPVAKYAFFCAFHSETGKDMIAADGMLTDLGKIYVS
jgi:hypothetical protein